MYKKLLSVFLASTIMASSFVFPAITASAVANTNEYEVYPTPQAVTYKPDGFVITDAINLVTEEGIDLPTVNKAKEILQSKGFTATVTTAVVEDKTNVLLGVYNSQAYVDTYFTANFTYTDNFHPNNVYGSPGYNSANKKYDQYVLIIDGTKTAKGVIGVLGANSTGTFYGLETLQMIFSQMPDKNIRNVQFDDYATSAWRGFIEGFYGDPWTHEARKSLMKFGGQFKANSYIYAPKDEPYHASKWRELYPADKLAELGELAQTGLNSKCNLIWAIHPGFSMIRWNDYAAELKKMTDKFEQLYSVGVRQFAIFFDDVGGQSNDNMYKLLDDASKWTKTKPDVKKIIYCPSWYNRGWGGADAGKSQFEALSTLDIEIMWTGDSVCGKAEEQAFAWVSQFMKKEPLMWLNWPVNDYRHTKLLMGKAEMLFPNVTNMAGIVSNPMNQAEASKVGIFNVLANVWNPKAFNREKCWSDGFKYLIPGNKAAQDAYRTVCSNLTDTGGGHISGFQESENVKDDLTAFLTAYKAGTSLDIPAAAKLIQNFDEISKAATIVKSTDPTINPEQALSTEIGTWMQNLDNLSKAGKYAVEAAIKFKNNDKSGGIECAMKAIYHNEISLDGFTISQKRKSDAGCANGCPSEVAGRRLKPFVTELVSLIQKYTAELTIPEATQPNGPKKGISSFTGNESNKGLDKIIDGNETTEFFTKQVYSAPGAYVGVDLGKITNVTGLNILLGNDNDTFHKFDLEHSSDGRNWTRIDSYALNINPSANNTDRITKTGLNLKTRYVRIRITAMGAANNAKEDYWTKIREFGITNVDYCYTNATSLATKEVTNAGIAYSLSGLDNITLAANEYVGIDLGSPKDAANITITSPSTALTYETSVNETEWTPLAAGTTKAKCRYIRAINKTTAPITTSISAFSFNINAFDRPAVTVGGGWGVYAGPNNAYDGNRDTFLHTNNAQLSGKWVQLDLNGLAMVKSINIVCPENTDDYMFKGKLQISTNGTTWEDIHTFTGGTIIQNFPTHDVPYRMLKVSNINKDVRFVRLITQDSTNNFWLRVSEIEVEYDKETVDNKATLAYDGDIATSYTPSATATDFTYKLSNTKDIKNISLLQADTNKGAAVSIRTDATTWTALGTLDDVFKTFDVSTYTDVFEVKLTFAAGSSPTINEITTLRDTAPLVPPAKKIVTLVKSAQTKAYTGNAVTFDAISIPNNLTGFTIDYKQSNAVATPQNIGTYDITVTRPADATYDAVNETIVGGLVIDKAVPLSLQPPAIVTRATKSITLEAITDAIYGGVEYSKDGTVWQDSAVFNNLNAGTNYTLYSRHKGNATYFPSAPSQVITKTLGDTDNNNVSNMLDVKLILNHAISSNLLVDEALNSAKITGNNDVTILDALTLLKNIVGIV